jgi:hypothetical protein
MSFVGSVERLKTAALDETRGESIEYEYGTIVPGVSIRGRKVERTGGLHVRVPKVVGQVAVSVSSQFIVLDHLNFDSQRLTSRDPQPSPEFLLRQQFTWDKEKEKENEDDRGKVKDGVVTLRSLTAVEAKYGDDEWGWYKQNPSKEKPPHLKLHFHPNSGFWTPKAPYRPTPAQIAVLAAIGETEEHFAPLKALEYSLPFSSDFVTYSPEQFDSLTDWMRSQDPA